MNSRKRGGTPGSGRAGSLPLPAAGGAMLAAMRAIARRDYTEAELRRLLARKFEQTEVDAAMAALVGKGWVGDARIAPVLAEREQRQRPAAAALVREKLIVRGVDESLAERASRDASAGISDAERMRALLRERFAGKKDEASKRRALALLARRGFEEEDAIAAVETVLGPWSPGEERVMDAGVDGPDEDVALTRRASALTNAGKAGKTGKVGKRGTSSAAVKSAKAPRGGRGESGRGGS